MVEVNFGCFVSILQTIRLVNRLRISGLVKRGKVKYASLPAKERAEMDDCIAMMTEAADQGHMYASAELADVYRYACVCAFVCARVCVPVRVCVQVCVRVQVCVCVRARYLMIPDLITYCIDLSGAP